MAPSRVRALRKRFSFQPSDDEIITSFLRPQIAGDLYACECIHDADVYSADPAALTAEFSPAPTSNGERAWYFFTRVRAKNSRGSRRARAVGHNEGRWHSEAAARAVINGRGRRVGHRQSFSHKKEDGSRSGWLMVEFGLDQEEDASTVLVVCKVYVSPRAPHAKTSAAATASGRKRKAAGQHPEARTCVRPRPSPSHADTVGSLEEDNNQGESELLETTASSLEILEAPQEAESTSKLALLLRDDDDEMSALPYMYQEEAPFLTELLEMMPNNKLESLPLYTDLFLPLASISSIEQGLLQVPDA